MYALVRNNTVEQVGPPRVWFDGSRWWDFRTQDPATYAAAGWLPVTEVPKPADTDTDTHDRSVELFGGVPTVVWTQRPWSADELTARTEQVNRETIEAQAITALTNNTDYLAIPTPTQAQAIAQVEALTRQNNKIIRLILGRLEGTE